MNKSFLFHIIINENVVVNSFPDLVLPHSFDVACSCDDYDVISLESSSSIIPSTLEDVDINASAVENDIDVSPNHDVSTSESSSLHIS